MNRKSNVGPLVMMSWGFSLPHNLRGEFSPVNNTNVCNKTIERHTVHTIVSWANPKQWVIVHNGVWFVSANSCMYIREVLRQSLHWWFTLCNTTNSITGRKNCKILCTMFALFCVLLWSVNGCLYSYPSGLLFWHWNYYAIVIMPVKWPLKEGG